MHSRSVKDASEKTARFLAVLYSKVNLHWGWLGLACMTTLLVYFCKSFYQLSCRSGHRLFVPPASSCPGGCATYMPFRQLVKPFGQSVCSVRGQLKNSLHQENVYVLPLAMKYECPAYRENA